MMVYVTLQGVFCSWYGCGRVPLELWAKFLGETRKVVIGSSLSGR